MTLAESIKLNINTTCLNVGFIYENRIHSKWGKVIPSITAGQAESCENATKYYLIKYIMISQDLNETQKKEFMEKEFTEKIKQICKL